MRERARGYAAVMVVIACAGSARGQDSVSTTPGMPDALSPYGVQTVRYTVDMIPVVSSWGNAFAFAPVLKASAGPVEWGIAQANASSAASADQRLSIANTAGPFALWDAPGAGVHPSLNSAPGSVTPTSFDRVFALALSDVGPMATNVIVGEIGQRADEPRRLFVTRRVAMSSRPGALLADSASLSLGAVDAHANVTFRADDFNATAKNTIHGDLILRVDTPARSGTVNAIFLDRPSGAHHATDPGTTVFAITSPEEVLNTPTMTPESEGGPRAITHAFSIQHLAEGGVAASNHLGPGVDAHRGNPAFSDWTIAGGVGTVASLGRSVAGGRADAINLYGVSATGAVTGTRAHRMPASITDPTTGFVFNNGASGGVFHHYWSQVSFRGPNGQVALGFDATRNLPIAAATAQNDAAGECIAVCRLGAGGSASWTIAAHIGKPILNASGGQAIATISQRTPVSISTPAADDQGNLYFIAGTTRSGPQGPEQAVSLIKAVNTPTGYQLEEIVRTGQQFVGENSATPFTIAGLSLGDNDSIGSASLHAGSIVASGKGRLPGVRVGGPASSTALGGLAVSAVLTYDRAGVPESYHALLLVGGISPGGCLGDLTGEGAIDIDDLNIVLSSWGNGVPPGTGADASGDGVVGVDDLNIVLSAWGSSCG